jgi:hypothetical protein
MTTYERTYVATETSDGLEIVPHPALCREWRESIAFAIFVSALILGFVLCVFAVIAAIDGGRGRAALLAMAGMGAALSSQPLSRLAPTRHPMRLVFRPAGGVTHGGSALVGSGEADSVRITCRRIAYPGEDVVWWFSVAVKLRFGGEVRLPCPNNYGSWGEGIDDPGSAARYAHLVASALGIAVEGDTP